METLAVLITEHNYGTFAKELVSPQTQLTDSPFWPAYWIGYYLVISDEGPRIYSPVTFHSTYVFSDPRDELRAVQEKP